MAENTWLMMGILVLLIVVALLFIFLRKKGKHNPDYYTFFIMGIIWLAIGIPLNNAALWILGLIFTLVGLAHKNKWKENKKTWKKMSKSQKKAALVMITILGILLVAGIVFYFIANNANPCA